MLERDQYITDQAMQKFPSSREAILIIESEMLAVPEQNGLAFATMVLLFICTHLYNSPILLVVKILSVSGKQMSLHDVSIEI